VSEAPEATDFDDPIAFPSTVNVTINDVTISGGISATDPGVASRPGWIGRHRQRDTEQLDRDLRSGVGLPSGGGLTAFGAVTLTDATIPDSAPEFGAASVR